MKYDFKAGILRVRGIRRELEKLAANSREARRYMDKTLALHVPVPQPLSRSAIRASSGSWKRVLISSEITQQRRELAAVRALVAAMQVLR